MLLPNFFVVLYILTFIIGAVFTTIIGTLFLREKSKVYGALLGFSAAFLLYTIFEFLLTFLLHLNEGEELVIFLLVNSNLCYDTFLLFWILLIQQLLGKGPIKGSVLIVLTGVYALLSEALGIKYTFYDQTLDLLSVHVGLGQSILLFINLSYCLMILYIGTFYLIKGIQGVKGKTLHPICAILPASLILYSLWIMCWDYNLVGSQNTNAEALTITDPLVSIYLFFCIIVTCVIYRDNKLDYLKKDNPDQDPSKSQGLLTEYYVSVGLTAREIEVTELVCLGMGNGKIAETLFISESTVKRHLNNIFRKTGTKGRFELMASIKNHGGK